MFLIPTEDPDAENAPTVPEKGTIELRTYRCQVVKRTVPCGLMQPTDYIKGECRSAARWQPLAGWHRVR